MPLRIIRKDITKIHADAIVNAANSALAMGGGVCGAIFSAAGVAEMTAACKAIGGCQTGQAVHTPGFGLKARTVIHTVGPVWQGGGAGEAGLLADCYRNSLELALELELKSIAFPLISSGIYGFPKALAIEIALEVIRSFLMSQEMTIYLVIFDKEAIRLVQNELEDLEEYIIENYQPFVRRQYSIGRLPERDAVRRAASFDNAFLQQAFVGPPPSKMSFELQDTFQERLLKKIAEKGMTDSEVYHKANLDRKLFSKIRRNKDYQPKKTTALALSIALELDLEEVNDLLLSAGYALSPSRKQDVIVKYFIERKIYDIYEINFALFDKDQSLLGG